MPAIRAKPILFFILMLLVHLQRNTAHASEWPCSGGGSPEQPKAIRGSDAGKMLSEVKTGTQTATENSLLLQEDKRHFTFGYCARAFDNG